MSELHPKPADAWVDLANYRSGYDAGRPRWIQALWYVVSLALFEGGCFPFRRPKVALLRLFGAKLGRGVVVKPHVRIKYPWRLSTGDHVWIGQAAWIDNLADVRLGSHVCLSQQVYLCTGSHDWRRRGFDLQTRAIEIGDGAWIAARATVLGGVRVGANAIVAAGSVAAADVPPAGIVAGNPATVVKERRPPESLPGAPAGPPTTD